MSHSVDSDLFDFANTSNRRSFILLALGAVIGLVIAGYGLFTAAGTATRTVPPEYVALVNQRPIYRSDYLAQLKAVYQVSLAEATPEQKQKTLDDMVDEELLVQRGLEADLPSYDPDVRNALVNGVELQLYASVMARQPSEDELQTYYQQHRADYSSLGMFQLRDLVMNYVDKETDAERELRAQSAIAALRSGQPIDKVLEQYKLRDSLRLQQAGKPDLSDIFEFAAEANLPAPVFAAAMKLEPNSVSEPIVVRDEGIHIVVMGKRRQAKALDFSAVRSRVWTDIKNAEQKKVRDSTLAYLRGKSEILTSKN